MTANTAKPSRVSVPSESVLAIIAAANLPTEEKAGWIKIYAKNGPKGARVYVNKGKTVRDFHIAGFTVEFGTDPEFKGHGNVKQALLTAGLTGDQILENFAALLAHLAALPVAAPRPSSPKAPKASPPVAAVDPEAQARRLAMLMRVAEEMGAAVSPAALPVAETSGDHMALADQDA